MMKRPLSMVMLLLAFSSAMRGSDKNLTQTKVEVVEGTTGAQWAERTTLSKTAHTQALSVKAVINGDHVMLTCYEQHRGCTFLGPGTYDGELKMHSGGHVHWSTGHDGMDPDLWISFPRPLDHAILREHYKVSGSW